MSEHDDDFSEAFDEDELASMYDQAEEPNMEDIFAMVMINKVKGTTVKIELRDKDGDKVEMPEIITQLLNYIRDKVKDGDNQFVDQVLPLMGGTLSTALGQIIGVKSAMFYLSQDNTRMAFIHSMALGFLLLKFVQQKGITIHTYEEEITTEEIEDFERRSKANNLATMAQLVGGDAQEFLRSLVKDGKITEEDFDRIMSGDEEDEESN